MITDIDLIVGIAFLAVILMRIKLKGSP